MTKPRKEHNDGKQRERNIRLPVKHVLSLYNRSYCHTQNRKSERNEKRVYNFGFRVVLVAVPVPRTVLSGDDKNSRKNQGKTRSHVVEQHEEKSAEYSEGHYSYQIERENMKNKRRQTNYINIFSSQISC